MSILIFETVKKRLTAAANMARDILKNLGGGPSEHTIVFSDDSLQTLGVSFKDPTDEGYYFLACNALVELAAGNFNQGLGYFSVGGGMLVPNEIVDNVHLHLLERLRSVQASLKAGTQPQSVGVFDKNDGVRAYRAQIDDEVLIVDNVKDDKGRFELA